jgi:hypothetical protein
VKISKSQLKQIIKEELNAVLEELTPGGYVPGDEESPEFKCQQMEKTLHSFRQQQASSYRGDYGFDEPDPEEERLAQQRANKIRQKYKEMCLGKGYKPYLVQGRPLREDLYPTKE